MSSSLQAQKRPIDPYGELGLVGGYSYYIGDINPTKHFNQRKKFAYGMFYRMNLTRRHALRLQYLRASVEGFDSDNEDPVLVNRNLNFRSKIDEISLVLEINYHDFTYGRNGYKVSPYLFGGLAYFNMNPEAELDGNYYELIPLGTEGQGSADGPSAYKRGQISIPFGAGVKVVLTKRISLNFEWGMRKTFTDHLDDVSGVYADPDAIRDFSGNLGRELADRSLTPLRPDGNNTGMQRGDPERNDWYVYSGITLAIRLGKDSNGCWR